MQKMRVYNRGFKITEEQKEKIFTAIAWGVLIAVVILGVIKVIW